jgi:hypothetical protein
MALWPTAKEWALESVGADVVDVWLSRWENALTQKA